jgi:muramidase (phage lysozyme)
MRTRSELAAALAHPNVAAFLRVIRAGEGTSDEDGYRRIVGGALFDGFERHPGRSVEIKSLGIRSTAAGAYQFLGRTWQECAAALQLPDFSPQSQDLGAAFLIDRRRALDDVVAGRLESAIRKCALEWASLPGSPYGQPTRTMQQARAVYERFGGTYERTGAAPESPPVDADASAGGRTMPLPAIALALLPELVKAIPRLAAKFGDGTDVPNRNLAAVETVFEIAKSATGAKNEQELVETIKRDPDALRSAAGAITDAWGAIDEIGGGIVAAREANVAASSIDPRRNMALWVTAALLPLVYAVVLGVMFGQGWPAEIRVVVVTAGVTTLGGIMGYWLGTSHSSAKKDDKTGAR